MIEHWDEVESGRTEARHIAGLRTGLGFAAGTKTIGVCRIQADLGAYTLRAGDGGLDVRAFGERGRTEPVSPQRVRDGATNEEKPVRAGNVSRPAGTGIAHAIRAGEPGLTVLAYGTTRPDDVGYHPRSSKIYFRGLGLIARLEDLEYNDGEPG